MKIIKNQAYDLKLGILKIHKENSKLQISRLIRRKKIQTKQLKITT